MNQEDQNYWTQAGTGAISGAVTGATVGGPWGALIGGGAGAVLGLYNAYQQNESAPNRPSYEIPDEVKRNLTQAEFEVLRGMPEVQKQQFLSGIQRNTAASLKAIGDRKGGLSGVSALNQQNKDAMLGLTVADEQARQAKLPALYAARQNMASYKDQAYQLNKLNPYYESVARQQANQGALMDTVNNAVNTGINMYGQGGYGSRYFTPNSGDPTGMNNYNQFSNNGRYQADYDSMFTS